MGDVSTSDPANKYMLDNLTTKTQEKRVKYKN